MRTERQYVTVKYAYQPVYHGVAGIFSLLTSPTLHHMVVHISSGPPRGDDATTEPVRDYENMGAVPP